MSMTKTGRVFKGSRFKTFNPFERWASKVERQESGCWNWTASKAHGYGRFIIRHGFEMRAHRFAFEAFRYSIPEGLTIDHLCKNPSCVNPFHMQPVTIGVNVLRGESFSAKNKRKTHCHVGHPLTGENLLKQPNGRMCRKCRNISARDAWRRRHWPTALATRGRKNAQGVVGAQV